MRVHLRNTSQMLNGEMTTQFVFDNDNVMKPQTPTAALTPI